MSEIDASATPAADAAKTKARAIRAVVSSDKMNKSRVAKVERMVKHPVVGKYMRRSTKIMFHDEANESRVGDQVLIVQSRPKSARKAFELSAVLSRSEVAR